MTVSYRKRPTTELAHLAWCLLVAVRMAQREGRAVTDLQQHLFIMQWLATAQKRRLFPKSVAPDILWLTGQGKRYGFAAKLHSKVEYIWRASAGELTGQSTLFRFTYFIEMLKSTGWMDFLLSPKEWREYHQMSVSASAVYTPKAELHPSFDEQGSLIKPLELRFTGDISGVFPLLEQCQLATARGPDTRGFSVLTLLPEQ
ncbi:DUF2913 family protein [Salmonella enterica]|nr:DUF2913 family protein [Salmonella enterica]EBU8672588.1 hypothetical protein [Salmonella enterica subsp. enterica serovar Panama]ECF2804347.1 DUF2913 family protein [Salmonella enterica subsp. enterica serovar Miami]EDB9447296.1 DUF2913 family protein [Salmonella enterica subsp. enterica serovar Enteritidis]EDW0701051.1 DUF2913 family protein [Salmonella enterica subsp. enterica]EHC9819281.1 DUF2913 family protein [Salmonella enterica subsp. enterica serovar Newport]MBA2161380.1 DUF2913 f